MSHLPTIISDLSMILLVAGITTLLFKRLNQPLVLGYIVAGIITGPHFSFFPTVADTANIQTWSEIGVIFLMFALGLEFSFYKLKSVGSTAFIATSVAVGGMLVLGYLAGSLLGWSHLDCLFLGGMLSMSSTAIVIKAFDDFGIKAERFAQIVFGMLIIEDIAGIVMMVILPTMAVSGSGSGTEILSSILRLVFFLVLWFVCGMYLVPTVFKRTKNLLNDETLLVASIGLCLGMVVMVTHMGFSSALGAFIMGSLIAEAPSAERIEHVVKPVKDLFGAVFFVSVGMLVDPQLLAEYALPVILLSLVTMIGKVSFSIIGVLATGHNLHASVKCGFALCQIGEFSFILASLGTALGVTSSFLYPIIVAVSVITTFATPFLIKAAEPAYGLIVKLLPKKVLELIERYTLRGGDEQEDADWRNFLQSYLMRMLVLLTLLTAISLAALHYLLPTLAEMQLPHSDYLAAAVTLLLMAPILRALLMNKTGNSELFSILWFKRRANHVPLAVLIFLKFVVAAGFLYFIFHTLAGFHSLMTLAAMTAACAAISSSDWLLGQYLRIESRFLVNLNEKHMRAHREASGRNGASWFDEDIHLKRYTVDEASPLAGKTLIELNFRNIYGCNVLQITSGSGKNKSVADMPEGSQIIRACDSLLMIGSASQLKLLDSAITQAGLGLSSEAAAESLKDFMLHCGEHEECEQFVSLAITIDKHSPILGKSMKEANLRSRWHCMVIGLERGAYTINNPHVSLVFEKGDLLWLLGKQKLLTSLTREGVL